MAGKKPFFVTGANAVINVGGVPVAFATDVSYRISVAHASPRVLGKFEVERHQPLKYDVSGNFTVIRYVRNVTQAIPSPHPAADRRGNGAGHFGTTSGDFLTSAFGLEGGRPNDNFDPSAMLRSGVFDIDIFQKIDGDNCQIAKLRGCRMVETELRVAKKGVAMQSFNFMAQYADEDSFTADKSGVGQELT